MWQCMSHAPGLHAWYRTAIHAESRGPIFSEEKVSLRGGSSKLNTEGMSLAASSTDAQVHGPRPLPKRCIFTPCLWIGWAGLGDERVISTMSIHVSFVVAKMWPGDSLGCS